MKYLFIDTNNFVSCALLYKEGLTPEAIDKLKHILISNKTKLLLPEIVEIEFFRVVDDGLTIIKEHVSKLKKTLESDFPSYLEYEKKEFMRAAEDILGKRVFSSKAAKTKIQALFSGDKIMKIPLTPEIFLNAIKRGLSGKRPYKYKVCQECHEMKNLINNDSLIFESIISRINELGKDNELIFCSDNTHDFADKDKKGLHPELLKDVSSGVSVRYYSHFVESLKKEFNEKIPAEEVKDITTYAKLLKPIYTFSDSTAAQIARLQQESGISKMMNTIQDSGFLQMMKATQEASTLKAMQDFQAMKDALESPAIKAMQDAFKSTVENITRTTSAYQEMLESIKSPENKIKNK